MFVGGSQRDHRPAAGLQIEGEDDDELGEPDDRTLPPTVFFEKDEAKPGELLVNLYLLMKLSVVYWVACTVVVLPAAFLRHGTTTQCVDTIRGAKARLAGLSPCPGRR